MSGMSRVFALILMLLSAPVFAENWKAFEDSDGDFWNEGAKLEVDLDSIRPVTVADAKDAAGATLRGPFVVATRRAVLSESGRETMKVDTEITTEYFACAGPEILRTGNGDVYSADVSAGKTRVKYEGKPDETYVFVPALTGWMKNLYAAVCAHAGSAGKP